MKNIPLTTLAYWAGILDGEGCIYFTYNFSKRRNICHTLAINIANTFKSILDIGRIDFGIGFVRKRKNRNEQKWQDVYEWDIKGRSACEFLELLLPYLVIKKEQAELAIYYFKNVKNMRGMKADEEQIQWRQEIVNKISQLKGRK